MAAATGKQEQKKPSAMDVLDVRVYMQLHIKTALFLLGGVSDLKVFDVFSSQDILAHSLARTGCNVNYLPRIPAAH